MSGITSMMFGNQTPTVVSGGGGGGNVGYLAFTGETSPYQQFYKVNSGNANRYDLIASQPDTTVTMAAHQGAGCWHPSGSHFFECAGNVKEIWSRSGDSFTKLSTPSITLPAGATGGAVWSPDGAWIAIPATNGVVYILAWDGSALTLSQSLSGLGPSPMWSCAFNPSSDRIIVCGDNEMRLASLSGGTWGGIGSAITSGSRHFDVDWSRDNNYIASVDIAGSARIYSVSGDTLTLANTMTGGGSGRTLGFSPDSKLLLLNASMKAFGFNGVVWTTITAPTDATGSDRRTLSFNGAGTYFALKPDSGQPKLWSISGSGHNSTFTYLGNPWNANVTVTGAGTVQFIDSPQNTA